MFRTLDVGVETWPLRTPFRIARGVREATEVVVTTIGERGREGRGEATPSPRYGQTIASVIAQIDAVADAIRSGADRERLRMLLPAGSARNAIDCALWDLDVQTGRVPAMPLPDGIVSAQTIGIDTPDAMARVATTLVHALLVKVKVDGGDPETCLRAVRQTLPDTAIIVDANEGWSPEQLGRMQPVLAELGIAFLEQPLPADADDILDGFPRTVPICADESCHVTADLDRLRRRYDMVNVKLDKTGGLTEAIDLVNAARRMDFGVMIGCMLATSLGIAPAWHLATLAGHADLDGPLWLRQDRAGGVTFAADGTVIAPTAPSWGTRRP